MLRFCQWLASALQYLEPSLLFLVTTASHLLMRTFKFCFCCLRRNVEAFCHKQMVGLPDGEKNCAYSFRQNTGT